MGTLTKPLIHGAESLASDAFLDALLADYPARDFQVRLPDGTLWGNEDQPRFTLVLKHPGSLRELFSNPSELTLGEAFIYGDYEIEGDIEAAFDLAGYLLGQERSLRDKFELKQRLNRLPAIHHPRSGLHAHGFWGAAHSRSRDRQAISFHYDLPTDFYALWLDQRMVYSCAYFASPDENLDVAQKRKLDYICRKLRLRPGERLLDIGCGWGGLVMHAAAEYGAQSLGITLSRPQAEVARQRVRQEGLDDRCRVEVADYRDLDSRQQYDKIVSVGMFEHVGEAQLPAYFQRAWELLRPGGTMLNHGISSSATFRRQGPSFIDRYVFPDGDLLPISTSLRAAELSGFEVRDVESLREHYALTLHQWVKRLESHADEARKLTDDKTYRTWRLYMAGSANGFRSGRLNLHQTLLAKSLQGRSGLPLTREDWYHA